MKIRITMNGKPINAQQAARQLLHPDRLAEKMLRQKVAGVVCDEHPVQCRELLVAVTHGKVQLEGICCDGFHGAVVAALQTTEHSVEFGSERTG